MRYCVSCLSPETRPNIVFNENGNCRPCQFSEEQCKLSQSSRLEAFREHCCKVAGKSSFESLSFSLGVSGGKDSLRQAIFCREVLNVEPTLLNVTYPPSQVSECGVRNIQNLLRQGFEVMHLTPSVPKTKELARYCFFEFGNLKLASEVALFTGAFRLAHCAGNDILLWGENPALTVGDSGAEGLNEYDGSSIVNINTLRSSKLIPEHLIRSGNRFCYDIDGAVASVKDRLVFMGSIVEEWSNYTNAMFSLLNGFSPRKDASVDIFGVSAVDEDFVLINQYIKFLKYGFGRTTDIVNELIRNKIISRVMGIALIETYDNYYPSKSIARFAKFIGVSESEVISVIFRNMNEKLFDRVGDGVYPLFKVGNV